MNSSNQHDLDRNSAAIGAEQSLRLIAALPAPLGIEDRVKARLRSAPIPTGVIGWPLTTPNRVGGGQASYFRAAAAAAIVFVVAGGGWGVYAHFQPAPMPAAQSAPLRIDGGGGLSPAGAMRTPKTVDGPRIAIPENVKQKTGPGKVSGQQRSHRSSQTKKMNTPSTSAPAPVVR